VGPAAASRAAEPADGAAARNLPWNFTVLVIDAVAFFAGLAFFDGATVVPLLLARLQAPDWVIGLTRLVQTLGFTLPALLAAHAIHGRARHKAFLLLTSSAGRAGLLTLPPALLLWAESRPGLVLAWFFVVISVFWLLDGGCAVSWFDIIAKTIPARVRGRFFGVMQALSGLCGMAAAVLATRILNSPAFPYPAHFAVLAACWCLGVIVSSAALFLIREPDGLADAEEKPRFGAYLRMAAPLIRANPRLGRLILARVALDGAAMATPFYVLFAQRDLGLGIGAVASYMVAKSVGGVAAGPLWGVASDRFGPHVALRMVALAVAGVPILALASAAGIPWLLPAAFFLMGAGQDGLWMVGSSTLLESVEPRDRPFAVGVFSLCQTPGALYGVAGGLLAQATSYPVVFACAAALALLGLALTLGIRAPGERGAPLGGTPDDPPGPQAGQ